MDRPRHEQRPFLVALDVDHPGFRDSEYRARRDAIARIALEHRTGDPVPDAPYTPEEQAVWRDVFARLAPLHRTRVCRPLAEPAVLHELFRAGIPQLAAMNRILVPATGFRMEPVAGLIEPRAFLAALGDGVFLSTQYIRHASRPDYTPEPDIVHEAIGHAASLAHPRIAEVNRAFGRAARIADDRRCSALERAYWFTLEFGLVLDGGEPKAFGAGLLSSYEELTGFADGPELRPFDVEEAAHTDYDPSHPQPRLFVARSSDSMLDELTAWLGDPA